MNWIKVGLLALALCIALLVGYNIGSHNMNKKWIEGSQKVVPVLIDYVIDRYEEAPEIEMLAESNKELIKTEGLLFFIQGMGTYIEGERFIEYLMESQ